MLGPDNGNSGFPSLTELFQHYANQCEQETNSAPILICTEPDNINLLLQNNPWLQASVGELICNCLNQGAMAVTISFSIDTNTLVIADDIIRNPADTVKALQKINNCKPSRHHNNGVGVPAARSELSKHGGQLTYLVKRLGEYSLFNIEALIGLPGRVKCSII